jgi:hypothetical protein
MRATFEQLREALIEGGYITQQQFDRDIASLDDPAIMAPSPLMGGLFGLFGACFAVNAIESRPSVLAIPMKTQSPMRLSVEHRLKPINQLKSRPNSYK